MRWMAPAALILIAACTSQAPAPTTRTPSPPAATAVVPSPTAAPTLAASPTAAPRVRVAYRLERRTRDAATGGFAAVVERTLTDPRGWARAGFDLVRTPDAPYLVVLAEGPEVDRLCRPYDTYGTYSCQNGPVVALNADRWRRATPEWTGDIATYRQMLVNHEVGHLLGQHHPPPPQCRTPGRAALVMSQQSTELNGCLPNPWPLPAEVARAARHDLPLAPPYEP